MKKIFLLLVIFYMAGVESNAQQWNKKTPPSVTAILLYVKNDKGFYLKKQYVGVSRIDFSSVINYYAFDKKNEKIYFETESGNFSIYYDKDVANIINVKKIPKLKGDDLNKAIDSVNERLNEKFDKLNTIHQQEVDARIKVEAIKKAKEDSILRAKIAFEDQKYKESHNPILVPVKDGSIYCEYCQKDIDVKDSLVSVWVTEDSIAWMVQMEGELDIYYKQIHKGMLHSVQKDYPGFSYHYKMFADSLKVNYSRLSDGTIKYFNLKELLNSADKLKQLAPRGFVKSWSWNNDYSNISFNITYMNTNKKTIKYIDIYWVALNDVGDIRKRGSFKGTGPVEEFTSGTWNWDNSIYYVSGDATKMRLTKIILTYMDGSKVTIPQNKIVYN